MLTKALFRTTTSPQQKIQRSVDIQAECASYCSSLDVICEESEMIAHRQSVFWSSSDVDPNVCSSSNSFSLPSSSPFLLISSESYGTTPLVNAATDVACDHQDDTPFRQMRLTSVVREKFRWMSRRTVTTKSALLSQ